MTQSRVGWTSEQLGKEGEYDQNTLSKFSRNYIYNLTNNKTDEPVGRHIEVILKS